MTGDIPRGWETIALRKSTSSSWEPLPRKMPVADAEMLRVSGRLKVRCRTAGKTVFYEIIEAAS